MQNATPDEVNIARTVGANVRAEMARAGKTQDQIAAVLHTGQSNLSERLRGTVPFRVHELVLVARELGIPVARFLEGVS